jgi:cell fate regulator YaaT (PSP1 superfamily)
MTQAMKPFVVGVRFSKVGKIYHFQANNVPDVKIGDMVVVETSRGWQLGQVGQIIEDAEPPADGWKQIDRRATPRDLLLRQMWQMKEAEVVSACHDRANVLRLNGIKIVSADYSFDGSRLTILYSTETEEKYDLKSLRQDMQKQFAPSQVDMRQVGPRDVAKTLCGMGACGLETRCCCLFLTEFSSISIRMAKEQGISLTPSEITGMCGRLRCCLIYEYDTYVDARSKLPKRNKHVRTPQGDGKVIDVVPLREAVIVELPEVGHREFPNSEILLLDESGNPIPEPGKTISLPGPKDKPVEREREEPEQNFAAQEILDERVLPDIRKEPPRQEAKPFRPRGSNPPRREAPPKGNFPQGVSQTRAGNLDSEKQPTEGPSQRRGPNWKKRDKVPGTGQPSQPGARPQSRPKPEANVSGGQQPQTRKDPRKKKGRQRDVNNDTQNGS